MSAVARQCANIRKKNSGGFVDTFTLPEGTKQTVPITTNMDVLALSVFWFSRARIFLQENVSSVRCWEGVSRNKTDWRWHLNSEGMGLLRIDLDTYLAAPGFNMLDDTRNDGSDRYLVMPRDNGLENAARLRARVADDPKTEWRGFLFTIYSDKQKTMDGGQRFERYLRDFINRWDRLVNCVLRLDQAIAPSSYPGQFMLPPLHARIFWQTIADIEADISRVGAVYDSQKDYTDYFEESAVAIKGAAEVTVEKGSQAVGEVAAWAADQAGKAAGNFFESFASNVGLWGIAFVGTLLYLKA